jgi:hypothetical protein
MIFSLVRYGRLEIASEESKLGSWELYSKESSFFWGEGVAGGTFEEAG